MSSYRQIIYHIVFGTKFHHPTLVNDHKKELYKYIYGIIRNKNCHLYRINGIENHIHILSDLHPSIALADFMKDIKVASSIWLKSTGKFPDFIGWAEGYGAFTYAYRDKDMIINYIKNQEEHHKKHTFKEEYIEMLKEFGVVYDEKYLF
jgi:REP element-mobilizing transposase RayT